MRELRPCLLQAASIFTPQPRSVRLKESLWQAAFNPNSGEVTQSAEIWSDPSGYILIARNTPPEDETYVDELEDSDAEPLLLAMRRRELLVGRRSRLLTPSIDLDPQGLLTQTRRRG